MSLKKLTKVKAFEKPSGLSWDAPADILAKWSNGPMAAEADDPNTISIFDVIGADWWTGEGVTAKRISAALRAIGNNPVNVKINSPGGDVFEGLAIYSLLAEHPAKVTVDVMGIAASAASIIAMSADELRMNIGTFLMIHNAWGVVVGNQHEMRSTAEVLASIDSGMADVYAARAAIEKEAISTLMDAETYMGPQEAVDKGFADIVTNHAAEEAPEAKLSSDVRAKRQLDAILASAGVPRSERRRLVRDAAGKHDAADPATHDAGFAAAAAQLLETISSYEQQS